MKGSKEDKCPKFLSLFFFHRVRAELVLGRILNLNIQEV